MGHELLVLAFGLSLWMGAMFAAPEQEEQTVPTW